VFLPTTTTTTTTLIAIGGLFPHPKPLLHCFPSFMTSNEILWITDVNVTFSAGSTVSATLHRAAVCSVSRRGQSSHVDGRRGGRAFTYRVVEQGWTAASVTWWRREALSHWVGGQPRESEVWESGAVGRRLVSMYGNEYCGNSHVTCQTHCPIIFHSYVSSSLPLLLQFYNSFVFQFLLGVHLHSHLVELVLVHKA